MSGESVTLTPKHYDKLGVLHVGVTHEGFVTVAGDVADIEDGQEITFDRTGVTVKRNGSEYVFSKAA